MTEKEQHTARMEKAVKLLIASELGDNKEMARREFKKFIDRYAIMEAEVTLFRKAHEKVKSGKIFIINGKRFDSREDFEKYFKNLGIGGRIKIAFLMLTKQYQTEKKK